MGSIGFAGVAWLLAILSYQHAFRLVAAPEDVQASGLAIVREELVVLEHSDFGRGRRGSLIVGEVRQLLAEERVVFAPMTTTRGLTWDPILGGKVIYIKVIELGGDKFLHQRPSGIMEALVHEAVHSLKNTRRRISVEEECDAFSAGMVAAAFVAGNPPPSVLSVDGLPVAEFVEKAYPKAPQDPGYKWVGE
ncbi:MAG: hypothetical protein HN341_03010 [Verrucomicrobia bacterium]|nr:hypothetical protein [Verrucomicrobiota bacterium]